MCRKAELAWFMRSTRISSSQSYSNSSNTGFLLFFFWIFFSSFVSSTWFRPSLAQLPASQFCLEQLREPYNLKSIVFRWRVGSSVNCYSRLELFSSSNSYFSFLLFAFLQLIHFWTGSKCLLLLINANTLFKWNPVVLCLCIYMVLRQWFPL